MSANAQQDDRDDPRPCEEPGAVRRDCAPHRGRWLRALGTVALVCGALSLLLLVPALIALPLGIAVTVASRRDLDCMCRGAMDPAGWAPTAGAEDLGTFGALASVPGLVVLLAVASYLLLRPYP